MQVDLLPGSEAAQQLEQALRSINADAVIHQTVKCQVDLGLILNRGVYSMGHLPSVKVDDEASPHSSSLDSLANSQEAGTSSSVAQSANQPFAESTLLGDGVVDAHASTAGSASASTSGGPADAQAVAEHHHDRLAAGSSQELSSGSKHRNRRDSHSHTHDSYVSTVSFREKGRVDLQR